MFRLFNRGNGKLPAVRSDPFAEAERDPNSLGNLALERGFITEADLDAALNIQKERLQLGQLLVEMGKLTMDQLEELLLEQKIRRGEVKDPNILIQFERRKKKGRLVAMRQRFAEARADAESVTASITTTLLEMKVKGHE